jgi:hypothetical protein
MRIVQATLPVTQGFERSREQTQIVKILGRIQENRRHRATCPALTRLSRRVFQLSQQLPVLVLETAFNHGASQAKMHTGAQRRSITSRKLRARRERAVTSRESRQRDASMGSVVPAHGFEPRFRDSKSLVLPLDDAGAGGGW